MGKLYHRLQQNSILQAITGTLCHYSNLLPLNGIPMTKPNITKQQLLDVLKSWGEQRINSDQLQDWMVTNYDPDDNDIGLGEPEWTQEAMNIVMNEYEIAKQEKFLLVKYQLAIDFITADESRFNQARHLFLHEGFCD